MFCPRPARKQPSGTGRREAFADAVFDKFETKMSEELLNELIEWASTLRSDAYREGYRAGLADAAYAAEVKQG